MALAARVDFTMEQGSRWYPDVILWNDSDGDPVDITSYAAKLQIRATKSASSALETMSSAFGDITLGGGAGTIQLDMSGERTRDITAFTRAVYDLMMFPHVGSAIVAAGSYTSATVDVDDGNDRSVITADGGTPFSVLSADDYVAITLSENGHEGVFKIYSVTNTILTLTETLSGTDNAADTAISIQELSNENAIRLIEGAIYRNLGVTS